MKNNKTTFLLSCVIVLTNGTYSEFSSASKLEGFYIIDDLNDSTQSEVDRMIDWTANKANQEKLLAKGKLILNKNTPSPLFILPMKSHTDDPGFYVTSNFVDVNEDYPGFVTDYQCGNRSYDLDTGYNHSGIDFRSWPFPWHQMDNSHVSVVAAAKGVISFKRDGHFDRSCRDHYGPRANLINVTHSDGSLTRYLHLKKGSLTKKEIGDPVEAGEFLGFIGSSGFSSNPHLHFETYDKNALLIEPFAGQCNTLNDESWWIDQLPYYDSKIVKIATSFQPPEPAECPQTQDNPHYAEIFTANDTVYFVSAYQDLLKDDVTNFKISQPDGLLFDNWNHATTFDYYKAGVWWWSVILPEDAQPGLWTFESEFLGITNSHQFYVQNDQINDSVSINQGMSGNWYTPQTSGSGVFLDIRPSDQFMFAGWFTHALTDESRPDSDTGTRWYTAAGNYQGSVAMLDLFETRGGIFNSSQAVTTTSVGTITFEFTDCSNGKLNYAFSQNTSISGNFLIQRALPGTESLCEILASETTE